MKQGINAVVSRRGAVAVGVVAGLFALGACGSAAPADEGSGGAIHKGVTITYAVQSFSHQAIQPIVDEFTKQTGVKVKLESGPATGQDLLTQLVPSFNAGKTPYDVLDADDPAGAALVAGGWLSPLPADVTKAYDADLSAGMKAGQKQWNVVDGKTYRLYHNWDMGYTFVNQPLLAAHGLKAPTTWAELDDNAKALKGAGIYSFADAASKPGLTFVYLAYLTAQSGGDLYKFDDKTRQAFEFAKKLIDDGAFPKDALTWTYDQSNAAYMANKVATMRQWPFFTDVAPANKAWYAPAKATITPPAAGPAGAKTWAGGWGMTVPKASTHKAEAMAFVKYMNSPEVAVKLAQASSFFTPARTSVLTQLGDKGLVKAMKEYSDAGYVTPRPYHPRAAQAETVIDEVGQAYLTGQISLDDAMSRGKQEIEALG
jgi:multiple sugar transport system substrate-binding protein